MRRPPTRRRQVAAVTALIGVLLVVLLIVSYRASFANREPSLAKGGHQFSSSNCNPAFLSSRVLFPVSKSATGVRFTTTMRNSSSIPCSFSGHGPGVRIVDASGDILVEGGQLVTSAPRNKTLSPNQEASFEVIWSSWCGKALDHVSLQSDPYLTNQGSWLTSSGELSSAAIPNCQNSRSIIETLPLR